MNVVMIPSVSGGLGHLGRTATLAHMIQKINPAVNVEYLIDTEKLRLFNIDSALSTGIKISLLPKLTRKNREAFVRVCLRDANVIVDDTSSYLLPLRLIVPKAAWVNIPMYPLGDELFMSWPIMAQSDLIIWAYPPVLDFPPELDLFGRKVLKTGPFLEIEDVPAREAARAKLGFARDEHVVLYSPRGMSFGRDFGERVLSGVFGAVSLLRGRYPSLRLVLAAVRNREELRAPGVPCEMPDYVSVLDVLPPAEMLLYLRASDIAVTEGSNMTQEAAALGTPIVMIPGTIYETWLLGTRLLERKAAHVIWIERVTPDSVAGAFQNILDEHAERQRMTEKARTLVTGGGGVAQAARLVLELGAERLSGEWEFKPASLSISHQETSKEEITMDPASVTLIATTAVNLLSPYLKKAGEEVGKQAGQEAWNRAKELYQAVKVKFTGKKEAEQSLDSFKDRPDDPQLKAEIESRLNEELSADKEFAVRVINLLEEADRARAGETFGITIHGNVEKLVNVRDIYGNPTFNL